MVSFWLVEGTQPHRPLDKREKRVGPNAWVQAYPGVILEWEYQRWSSGPAESAYSWTSPTSTWAIAIA